MRVAAQLCTNEHGVLVRGRGHGLSGWGSHRGPGEGAVSLCTPYPVQQRPLRGRGQCGPDGLSRDSTVGLQDEEVAAAEATFLHDASVPATTASHPVDCRPGKWRQ